MTSSRRARESLETVFRAGLRAVDAAECLRRAIRREAGDLRLAGEPLLPGMRLRVLAAGKAAAAMAGPLEQQLGQRIAVGLCVTKEGHGGPLQRFALHEAGHPIPDARSVA
ncbi:MAG: DUF4147 domain-containing protein, partial [Myxococcota bacterium]